MDSDLIRDLKMPYSYHTGIIYAAGVNRRLGNSLGVPFKGLLPLESDGNLILRQANHLIGLGINKLVIVVGMEHQALVDAVTQGLRGKIDFAIAYNADYATKGNMLSFWVAREHCPGAVTFTTSDLYFDGNLPQDFTQTGQSMILVDDTKTDLLSDPDPVKVKITDGIITRIHKRLSIDDTDAVNPGFYHYNEDDTQLIFKDISQQIETQNDDQSLYLSLDRVTPMMQVYPHLTGDVFWADVDTPEDLQNLNIFLQKRQ